MIISLTEISRNLDYVKLRNIKEIYEFDNKNRGFSSLMFGYIGRIELYGDYSHLYTDDNYEMSIYKEYKHNTVMENSKIQYGLIERDDRKTLMELACGYQYKDRQPTYNKFKYTYKLYKKHKKVGRLL